MKDAAQHGDPHVLLLGNVDREGVLSTISQSGKRYKRKDLHSNPENWMCISDMLVQMNVSCILAAFTPRTYSFFECADYDSVGELLLSKIGSMPHAVFIHDDLFTGAREGEFADDIDYPPEAVRQNVNDRLERHNINVLTYHKSSEVTILAVEFLSRTETGLLLRLYVPHNQLWANETDRLLQLFIDYLTRAASMAVRLDEIRTKSGVIYELRGDPHRTLDIAEEFRGFSEFMGICLTDPAKAELILRSTAINLRDISHILARYAKEARRLQVDMRQEREQKVLQIRHRLESELIDVLPSDLDLGAIGALVESTVPTIVGPHSALQLASLNSVTTSNLTLNINPQYVETVHGIVAQEVSGDVTLNQHDEELFKLFAAYGSQQQAELVSALRELKDESAPIAGRLTAKQAIGKFLRTIGSKATDIGVGILQAYIQKQVLGS